MPTTHDGWYVTHPTHPTHPPRVRRVEAAVVAAVAHGARLVVVPAGMRGGMVLFLSRRWAHGAMKCLSRAGTQRVLAPPAVVCATPPFNPFEGCIAAARTLQTPRRRPQRPHGPATCGRKGRRGGGGGDVRSVWQQGMLLAVVQERKRTFSIAALPAQKEQEHPPCCQPTATDSPASSQVVCHLVNHGLAAGPIGAADPGAAGVAAADVRNPHKVAGARRHEEDPVGQGGCVGGVGSCGLGVGGPS